MMHESDTIVAIATPAGRGGIGVVRVSGPAAQAVTAPLLRVRRGLAPGRARFAELLEEGGKVIDEAVVTLFGAPHSYTAEDVVEISVHGAPVLLEWVVRACLRNGARLARAGEFTERAFLSGRLDLTQAEAVNDLIAAQTMGQARLAAAQLGGSVARAMGPVKQELIGLIAGLEAGVDFAEDDLDLMTAEEIAARVEGIRAELEQLTGTYARGRVLREGFSLAIVGRPNAGKSSLFNRLLERERAIVTAEPGTTRDAISERMSLQGIPVEVIDTAGLRAAAESDAERQGMERSRTTMAEADVVLLVIDATTLGQQRQADDAAMVEGLSGRAHVVVVNKCDLARPEVGAETAVVSAATGEGLEELRRKVVELVIGAGAGAETAMITNLRQHGAVEEALTAMTAAGRAAAGGLPHEMLLLDLYTALGALDALTGATTPEDILELIFSSFCIGK